MKDLKHLYYFEQFAFYRIPKVLFTDDYFERMIRKIKKGGSHE